MSPTQQWRNEVNNDESEYQTVDLDCPPGGIRPWDLIAGVMEGTGIELRPDDTAPGHAMFGHREWTFKCERERWVNEVQPIIKPRIEALFNNGTIRYGSW
jgi:hypothetical protein